jgi:hypothetical protein
LGQAIAIEFAGLLIAEDVTPMRRAGHERTAVSDTTSPTPPAPSPRGKRIGPPHPKSGSTSIVDPLVTDVLLPVAGTLAKGHIARRSDRRRPIDLTIRQRIESRLPGRIRNLNVRLLGKLVVLEGQCSTYYSKQLAQHAALGVLEDEQLENAIVVSVPR